MTDQELLALMPETMRDAFSYAAGVCSDATGGMVKPGIFRVAFNNAALEYARAVLGAADVKPTLNDRQIRSSLVERVAIVCAMPCKWTWDDQARAAIREVAAWLSRESEGHLGDGAHWADRLQREAEQ